MALSNGACSAALRFEEAFIDFIESGEQRMVIDESLTGFGVRVVSFHACLEICEAIANLRLSDLVTRTGTRWFALTQPPDPPTNAHTVIDKECAVQVALQLSVGDGC